MAVSPRPWGPGYFRSIQVQGWLARAATVLEKVMARRTDVQAPETRRLLSQAVSLAHGRSPGPMSVEATGVARTIPRSGTGSLAPWQALSPARLGLTGPPQKGTRPSCLPPDRPGEAPKKEQPSQGAGRQCPGALGCGQEGGTCGGCWRAPGTDDYTKACSFLA